jgi:hypothetical protein
MKWNFAAAFAATVMQLLGIKHIPIENKEVSFNEDQLKELRNALKDEAKGDADGEKALQKMLTAFNRDIKEAEKNNEASEIVQKKLREALEGTNLSEGEIETALKADDTTQKDMLADVLASNKKIIEQLSREPEADDAKVIDMNKNRKLAHSATHLFADNKAFNAFDGRNWNRKAAGLTTVATDWSGDKTQIDKLNGDLTLYYRENPDEIKSLQRDTFGLPAFWPKRFNVVDIITTGTITTAEVTQARKLPWLPKNRQNIQAEEGRIYPAAIDLEFVGYFLQQMEASWVGALMNNEGSQPKKMTFVMFLLAEISKKARIEDRISTIKGVYVETPKDATVAGKFLNRQNGVLYQLWKARDIDKKYKAFSLGTPTTSNIVDYVDEAIESLPIEVRTMPGLILYTSPYWMKAYKRRYEQIHGTQNDYTGYPVNPKDYANVAFEVLPDLEGHDFMFMTFSDNIEILENVPAEKSMYTFEHLKRIIYIYADYKLGVRVTHIGTKVKDGDPLEFKVQTVWSNDVPIFDKNFVSPVFDNGTGEIKVNFNNLQVAADWATNVTEITGYVAGQVLKIKGNTELAAVRNIVDGGTLDLASNFNLQSGGTLTLIATGPNAFKELSRTAGPAIIGEETNNFTGTSFDATKGYEFNFIGANATLADILNGVDGKVITIKGGAVGDLTINDVAGKIDVTATAILATAADSISLVRVDGVWLETSRTIA